MSEQEIALNSSGVLSIFRVEGALHEPLHGRWPVRIRRIGRIDRGRIFRVVCDEIIPEITSNMKEFASVIVCGEHSFRENLCLR